MKKKCSVCGKEKKFNDFHVKTHSKIGYRSECKVCGSEMELRYKRTKKGLIKESYKSQLSSSRTRGHVPPSYSGDELVDRFINDDKFIRLYDEWVKSGYDSMLKPSFDREDSNNPYTLNTISITTWFKNKENGYKERMKPVKGINMIDGNEIYFESITEAQKELNLAHGGISKCCNGKASHCNGYNWEHITKDEYWKKVKQEIKQL